VARCISNFHPACQVETPADVVGEVRPCPACVDTPCVVCEGRGAAQQYPAPLLCCG
jgi:hypothetical protein